jgi:CRP/FNR family cyclic AMP-dependent transcriptional regulator
MPRGRGCFGPMSTAPGPYNLRVIESCFGCAMREGGVFCHLPQAVLNQLNSLRQTALYPRRAVLFVEGESPRGLFILCSGRARLTANSRDGQSITLRFAEQGEVLGLSSVISNSPYPANAETVQPSQVSFIPRLRFLQFLRSSPDAAMSVAKHLSMELHRAWEQTRLIALAPSAQAKLAQFLLECAEQRGQKTAEGVHLALDMTHEEIARYIGSSRESVSRILSDFKNRELIRIAGGALIILQSNELQTLIGEVFA